MKNMKRPKPHGGFVDHMVRDQKPKGETKPKPRGYDGDLKANEDLAAYKGGDRYIRKA